MQPTLKEWLNRASPRKKKPRLPLKRSQMKKVGERRQKENRIYLKKRRAFLKAHPYCQIWLARIGKGEADVVDGRVSLGKTGPHEWTHAVPRSTEIHHVKKRGRYYLDESTWLAASREEHDWVHNNAAQARALGLLV